MYKWVITILIFLTTLFGQVRDLTSDNFEKATARNLVVVEFWAGWNETNKVTILDE